MKHQKILNLLNEANDYKYDKNMKHFHWYGKYGKRNEFINNTDVLRSNLCDYNNAYILVRGQIAVAAAPATQIVLQKLMKRQ